MKGKKHERDTDGEDMLVAQVISEASNQLNHNSIFWKREDWSIKATIHRHETESAADFVLFELYHNGVNRGEQTRVLLSVVLKQYDIAVRDVLAWLKQRTTWFLNNGWEAYEASPNTLK